MTAAIENQLPAKPLGSTWTDDQWRAIVTGGSNILVAAAAGSGKTAVLVERIIRKIAADTDVDRLLVATFTKAAAAEMKERIRIALEKELDKKPDSDHLRRQLALMGRASITTLHSFCLDVIRRYYSLIGLDPGFRIANETEAELLRMDVLDELFEERYAAAGEPGGGAFLALVDRFGGERGDEPLYALVLKLYNFAQSNPWPKAWLQQTAASFRVRDAAELGRTDWVASLGGSVALTLQGAERLLEQALGLTRLPAGPDAYGETFQDDLAVVRGLIASVASQPWETWHEAFGAAGFGKLKSQRGGDAIDKSLQEQAKDLREQAKSLIGGLNDELFVRSPEQFAAELQESAPFMETLAELVDQFGERFEAAKLEKGLIDFGDMEHYCLRILREGSSTPERMTPSAAALEYQQQFDEILLDEYQDTNMVQEAIVSLISRPGRGNRFMVGDVKQSIYRFRLAEPGLFLHKYKSYVPADELPEANASAEANAVAADAGQAVFEEAGAEYGVRIDLARNFRSRQEVVDGVNDVFRAIMREKAAEMDYDARAELVCGASYPAAGDGGSPARYAVELAVLDRGGSEEGEDRGEASDSESSSAAGADGESPPESPEELQTVQMEARWIARQILRLKGIGPDGANTEEPFLVYDGKKGRKRPLAWRDIVILLRADKQWAPVIIEELQQQGIPAYAELSSGYFEATEVETMLSLLRVIDNPYQDIPLAGALRSPIVGLSGEELALIRIAGGRVPYFEAVRKAAGDDATPEELSGKLQRFMDALEQWRGEARQGSLADLLWRIYRETGYYDLVGGMTGGLQRQANLRALHDRTRQYEATTLRGLFRFLRFIDRMRDSGGDLGTARALGEQEDVVRIMSIHKSKGLEFPVVFAAGLGKSFNKRDLSSPFLMHKQLGFGPRYVDTELRVAYPTLPYLAIKQRLAMESLAEEMRILYVALTRPKEKMFLVGTVANAEKQLQRWQTAMDAEGRLPDFRIASAARFLDWLGPLAMGAGVSVSVEQLSAFGLDENAGEAGLEADKDAAGTVPDTVEGADIGSGAGVSAEQDALPDREEEAGDAAADANGSTPDTTATIGGNAEPAGSAAGNVVPFGDWRTSVVPASLLGLEAAAAAETDEAAQAAFEWRMTAVQQLAHVEEEVQPEWTAEIERRLDWRYPYAQASLTATKTSVTEMKRLHAEIGADEDALLLPELAGMAETAAEDDEEAAGMPDGGDFAPIAGADPEAVIADDGLMEIDSKSETETATAAADAATGPAPSDLKLELEGEAEEYDLFSFDFGAPAGEAMSDHRAAGQDEPAADRQTAARHGSGGEYTFRLRRPRFMEEAALTAAERGTVSHLVMQHIPLGEGEVTEATIARTVETLVARRMLTKQQADAVDAAGAAAFFAEEVGRRLLAAPWVRRETPFSCTLPASRVYPDMPAAIGEEPVLIQGVIDCLYEDDRGLVLLDYKTDRVRMGRWNEAAERHRFQLTLYAEAIAGILGRKVDECYVFFLDGGKAVKLF